MTIICKKYFNQLKEDEFVWFYQYKKLFPSIKDEYMELFKYMFSLKWEHHWKLWAPDQTIKLISSSFFI